ncbi:MFS transporter [Halomonas dongshanensis]|uniref:MFS transporter n=1 Tax=Halomonas dongshanensis TaxID=2890835 RepID=A0ABT2EDU7_9GAMM|nr:MFS transporter [Halomonas dongshanensis]MCS2609528.1 MFS transporter [Halomonas dongshanensis]
MPKSFAVTVLLLCLFTVTFAVNLQAPLYSAYVAESTMGATAVTVAFAAYVAGLMPTLVFLGGLSDRIGRRIPIIMALVFGGIGTLALVVAPGWISLVLARCLLGVGTGLATTAGTAYMAEIMGEQQVKRAALIVTSSTTLGFGGGALATGISLSLQGQTFFPSSFALLFVAVPLLALLVIRLPRCDEPRAVSLLRLPVFPSSTWPYGAAMGVAWSTTGMTIAIVPLELQIHDLGNWTGLVIFLAIFIGFLCQPLAKRLSNPIALGLGFFLTPFGYLVLLAGSWSHSILLVLVGAAFTSASSYGFTYLAALSEFSMRSSEERARASAGLFVYAYVGFSIPVIASGVLADRYGVLQAMAIFGGALLISTLVVFWAWHKSPEDSNKLTASVDTL